MKILFKYIVISLALFCCALVACTRVPDDVLDKEKMAALMVDVHIGEAVVDANASKYPDDSLKRVLKQSIYAKHGVTTEQVDHSFRWYGSHMDKYIEVYDRVIEIINADMEDARQRAGVEGVNNDKAVTYLAFEGDSVDVWNDVRFRLFASNISSEYMPFIMKSDNNWERGDVYTFRYKLLGTVRAATFTVAVDYSDGSKEFLVKSAVGDGWHEAAFALDSARTAREVYGSLSYVAQGPERVFVDSISMVRTRWQQWRKPVRQSMKNFREKRRSSTFD